MMEALRHPLTAADTGNSVVDTHKIVLKQESFYLLSIISWLHPFQDLSRWEFRSGNRGIFMFIACGFVFMQMLVLFDLAYQEDMDLYKCKGNSARLSVVVCACLVLTIISLKMLDEERRTFVARLVLMRHATEFALSYSLYSVIFGDNRKRAAKLLISTIFQKCREFGVVVFVYVAAVEQLMLFDDALDYIINSVVVLLIAELDELSFKSLARIGLSVKTIKNDSYESEESSSDSDVSDGDVESGHVDGADIATNTTTTTSATIPVTTAPDEANKPLLDADINRKDDDNEEPVNSYNSASAVVHLSNNNQDQKRENSGRSRHYSRGSSSGSRKSDYDMPRPTLIMHYENPADIHQMTTLNLTEREHRAYLMYDYFIVRIVMLSMILPLVHSKITGVHCGEESRYRASEVVMLTLMSSRVLLNVCVDVSMVNFKRKKGASVFSIIRHVIWSLLEHTLPGVGYIAMMYMIFVVYFKPPLDDDGPA